MKHNLYLIENLDISGIFDSVGFEKLTPNQENISLMARIQADYLPWEIFKNKDWAPKNHNDKKEIWALAKLIRRTSNLESHILDKEGKPFVFNPRSHVEFLHEVDLEMGGNFMGVQDFSASDKQKFIRRNLIEESIASSQLEGANTSRQAAKKMLMEGRSPNDKSEQMIVNNHKTMQWIEEELKHKELTIDILKELHRTITESTIDKKHQGVLRETLDEKGEPLVIKPWNNDKVAYITPSKEFVEVQLPNLIDFANDKTKTGFIHPLVKAIMLHFWIGLLHPFEDGNGRLARVLFYWYMLRKGYWAFSYLSLSERLLKSPAQYAMAYIYSEQDDNDLNYFIHYNVEKLKLAREHFKEYIARKVQENRQAHELSLGKYSLNKRQASLLQYLGQDEQRFTTLSNYLSVNKEEIGKVTAASDLKKLVEAGLLKKIRNGRNIFYYPTPKIRDMFK